MLKHVTEILIRYGTLGLFVIGLLDSAGVPLPAAMDLLLLGVAINTPTSRFLIVILAARLLRYFGLAFLGIQLGENAEGFLRHNGWGMVAGLAVMALLVMVAIRWYDRRRADA